MRRGHLITWLSLLTVLIQSPDLCAQERVLLRLDRSEVTFLSEAPLEHITASNTNCTGLVDPAARTFAVQVPISGFEGFNSPMQREHFNENYMESSDWPAATFAGRIIEGVDLTQPGTYSVRAKGTLKIHGIEQERVVPCTVVVAPEGVRVTAAFDVAVADHGIRIPRIVQQKIAAVIKVKVDVLFKNDKGK
ncbi:MAG: YceI family protein [Flavobacteriales bacterium]|nr:YceI family protein [Flavobacteriales bacterium]MCB0758816.1 YceI family protein [Flavobacteriales bacterium]